MPKRIVADKIEPEEVSVDTPEGGDDLLDVSVLKRDVPQDLGEEDDSIFDLDRIRETPEYVSDIISPVLMMVEVCKPPGEEFIRVCPDPNYGVKIKLLDYKKTKGSRSEYFFVKKEVMPYVASRLRVVNLRTAITGSGEVFLWPVPIPGVTIDSINEAHVAAARAAVQAEKRWIRLTWDKDKRGYAATTGAADLREPVWPEETFQEIFQMAFRNRSIREESHLIVQRILGLIL